jgi:hypothetical protein
MLDRLAGPNVIPRGILLAWAIWWSVIVATNLTDALQGLGILGPDFGWTSGNYAMMAKGAGGGGFGIAAFFGWLLLHAAESVVPRAWMRAADPEATRLAASVLNLMSLGMYLDLRGPEAMLACAVYSLRLARRVEGPSPTALANSMMAIAMSGAPKLADRYLAAAEAVAAELDDPRERLDAALGRLMLAVAHERWADGHRLRDELLPTIRASGSETLHCVFLGLFAVIDLLTGDVQRCAERAEEMVGVAEREGYLQARG